MDSPFVYCPYDKKHQVSRLRLQAHIVKCQKNYPGWQICPYNATHRFPHEDILREHLVQCPSKAAICPEHKTNTVTGSLYTPKPILQKDYLPETDPDHEMWD
ncbi:gametocyte-specific factor 1-like [Ostrinia nubilalis]|uniref:gametocyte-specific factor 1-like n=1 Tax=Ostrinia furnacalis TaxID=93504 RepID=UPI00103E3A16|nr:gametocyte-specific factor 1-like [Ostrinia furnacalis]